MEMEFLSRHLILIQKCKEEIFLLVQNYWVLTVKIVQMLDLNKLWSYYKVLMNLQLSFLGIFSNQTFLTVLLSWSHRVNPKTNEDSTHFDPDYEYGSINPVRMSLFSGLFSDRKKFLPFVIKCLRSLAAKLHYISSLHSSISRDYSCFAYFGYHWQ